jgi:hypothetical protein
LQVSFESAKEAADEQMKRHIEEVQAMTKHQQELVSTLSACQADLKHATSQVDTLQQQVETTSRAHQQNVGELEQAREDWKNLEEMMKNISNDLVGTKSAALDTLRLADTIANNQQAQSNALLTDSLNSRICDLNEQVERLTLKNSELELASRDLVERHKLGMLVATYRSRKRSSHLPIL